MQKFVSTKHGGAAKALPFSYFSTPSYLDFDAFTFPRNGENLIVSQDILFPHEFPSLYLPRRKKNWERASFMFASQEDIEKIKREKIEIRAQVPVGEEFFYPTKPFIYPQKKFGQRVRQFQKNYNFRVFHAYPKDDVQKFYSRWKRQRQRTGLTFDEGEQFFFFCLKNLRRYKIQQVYVEVDERLVGLAWGVHHQKGWVGLHLKADYSYKGLSRFLQHERAKLFGQNMVFTLGTGAHERGIESYKKELEPLVTIPYTYIATGEKIR